MRWPIAILLILLSPLLLHAQAVERFPEGTESRIIFVSTDPSVLATPTFRRRARAFHRALRLFANPESVQPNTDCVDLRQAPDGAVLEVETCHNSGAWWRANRPDSWLSAAEHTTNVRVFAGRPPPQEEEGSWTPINIATTDTPELEFRACELATWGRPIVCVRGEPGLLYPGDRSTGLRRTWSQSQSNRVSNCGVIGVLGDLMQESNWVGHRSTTALVQWPRPDVLPALRVRYPGTLSTGLPEDLIYLWRLGVVQLSVVSGTRRSRLIHAERLGDRSWPYLYIHDSRSTLSGYEDFQGDKGFYLEAEYPNAQSGKPTIVRSPRLRSPRATHVDEQSYACMPVEESGWTADSYYWSRRYLVAAAGQICFYVPWWAAPEMWAFLCLLFFLAVLAWKTATKDPQPRFVVIAEKQQSDYRVAARIREQTTSIHSFQKATRELGFWLFRTPFGWMAVSRRPVNVCAESTVVDRRRLFLVRSDMLVMSQRSTWLFVHDIREEDTLCARLEDLHASESHTAAELRFTRQMRALSRRKRWAGAAGGAIFLFVPSASLPWILAPQWPILTQRLPTMALSTLALLVLAIVVRLIARIRSGGPSAVSAVQRQTCVEVEVSPKT